MSIHSMTGFANVAGECGSKRINLELRAVNHRYLDVQFKMPDDSQSWSQTIDTLFTTTWSKRKTKATEQAFLKTPLIFWFRQKVLVF